MGSGLWAVEITDQSSMSLPDLRVVMFAGP